MITRNVEAVQGHFSSANGHYNPSGAQKQVLRSPLVAGCAWPSLSPLGSAASPWLPPLAPFSFEAWPCVSLSLLFPDLPHFHAAYPTRWDPTFPTCASEDRAEHIYDGLSEACAGHSMPEVGRRVTYANSEFLSPNPVSST